MNSPIRVNSLPIVGPFSVIDAKTGRAVYTYTSGPGDIMPDVSALPVCYITARADCLMIYVDAIPSQTSREEEQNT